MKKMTLQGRITCLTALVLLACTVTLTLLSMHSAEVLYLSPGDGYEVIGSDVGKGAMEAPLELAKRQFDGRSILYCCLFTGLGTVAVYLVTGRALRPLRDLSDKVDTVDEHNLSVRLPAAPAKDEISRLTDGCNRMLARLEDAFLRQKRFTANAAHELKTPLATMKTGIQVLEEDPKATLADHQRQAQETLESVDRLAAIVDDLLVLATTEVTGSTEQEEVLLEPLFDALCSELAIPLADRDMKCQVDCGEVSVLGNPSFLYRTFFNLMENACKYGRPGGTISIQAAAGSAGTEVLVADDGPGIPPEHLPYIFDAFYRVDKSRSRAIGGSGLGLSIVKAMVEACGGGISAESDGKRGTCFRVWFPG